MALKRSLDPLFTLPADLLLSTFDKHNPDTETALKVGLELFLQDVKFAGQIAAAEDAAKQQDFKLHDSSTDESFYEYEDKYDKDKVLMGEEAIQNAYKKQKNVEKIQQIN